MSAIVDKEIKMTAIKNFIVEEDGLTTVEYAIAGALVAAAVILAFTGLGQAVAARINNLSTTING